jgi:hypothetical protein
VYLARDRKHDRLVALKTLNPDVGSVAADRFLREIQVSAGMQHPHILPTYDSGIADGRLYFVMPFVDGGSLRERLEAEPKLPIAEALQCAHDIALALAFAHDQGVVHRDVKPENIMFYHGHACLADFGVARVMQEMDIRVTGHGMIVGTPAYMSPEQLTDGGFDGRSDVYSLACVLYEMIAGVHAFSGSTPRELLRQRLRNPPPPLHTERPDAPQFVEDLLTRALSASPEGRFEDAHAFADAIEFALRDLASPRRISAPRRAIESMPRHPLAWVASGVLGLAAVVLAATPLRTLVRDKNVLPLAPAQQLELAKNLELQRQVSGDRFRVTASRLAAMRASFHGRDSLFAEGMIALAERSYPRACDSFNRLRTTDSLDAFAWIGLGDCTALDSAVVPDANGGWHFRTGWHSAARAYMRAVAIDPAMHKSISFAAMAVLLPATPDRIRAGKSEGARPETFLAHPSLIGDTIAYVPIKAGLFAAATPDVDPITEPDALRQNRDVLVAFGRQWVSIEPKNPEALEALAVGLETRGELSDADDGASGVLNRARKLAKSPEQRLRLGSMAVRLRIKRAQFEPARALADSLLSTYSTQTVTPADASRLAGLAALTGRVRDAGLYRVRSTSGENADAGVAPQVTVVVSQLFVRAALGVCDDSLMVLSRAVDDLLQSYTQATGREAMRASLLARPMSLAYPCVGARGFAGIAPQMPLDRAQRAEAARNIVVVQATLDSVDVSRRAVRPGDVSLDFSVQEAWLRAAIGDTAGAVRRLDLVLNALPTLGSWAVREEAQSAALGRAMLLRAELAAAQKDNVQRRRRAGEALSLWKHADAPMYPTLERLRALASR